MEDSGSSTDSGEQYDNVSLGDFDDHLTEEEMREFAEEIKKMDKNISILCGGPTGVGKSTLLNGLMGVNVANPGAPGDCISESSFHVGEDLTPGTLEVSEKSFTKEGICVKVWDTPGLEGSRDVDAVYLQEIKDKCSGFDLFLYCVDSSETRATELFDEKSSLRKFTELFGKRLWKKAVILLTKANNIEAILKGDQPDLNVEEEFKEKISEWRKKIRHELHNSLGVKEKRAKRVPILPAGKKSSPNLPGYSLWLSKIFAKVCDRMDHKARMAYIFLNADRLKRKKDINLATVAAQSLQDQPIVPKFKFSKKAAAAATTAGGTTAGVIGAATGATVGAIVLGAASFGVLAGVGLAVGGVVGAAVGSGSVLAASLAVKHYKKRKYLRRMKQKQKPLESIK